MYVYTQIVLIRRHVNSVDSEIVVGGVCGTEMVQSVYQLTTGVEGCSTDGRVCGAGVVLEKAGVVEDLVVAADRRPLPPTRSTLTATNF